MVGVAFREYRAASAHRSACADPCRWPIRRGNNCEFAAPSVVQALRFSQAAGQGCAALGREVAIARLRFRSLAAIFLAVVCAAVLGTTSMLTSAFEYGVRALKAEVALLSGDGWILGGTGNPVPDPTYIGQVEGLYLSQFSGYDFQGLETPEQFCPIV